MNHPTLIAVFVVIAAIAIVIQMFVFLGFYLMARRLHKQASLLGEAVRPGIEATVRAVKDVAEAVSFSKESIRTVAENASGISRLARERAGSLDMALGDLVSKTRSQAERIDQLFSTLVDQVETTANAWQRTVLGPIQQIAALAKGFQTGLDFFLSRRHSPTVREATQDEEMFI